MKQVIRFFMYVSVIFVLPVSSQTTWLKYEGNPVFDIGPSGSWDRQDVGIMRIIPQDSIYQMWYTGSDGNYFRMGYATSNDRGVTWTKHPDPVLDRGPQPWESIMAYVAYVNFSDSNYSMWYTGYSGSNWRIGYATSPDGIAWTKRSNPILVNGPASWDALGVEYPMIMGPDSVGGYKMWYTGKSAAFRNQIGFATATDDTTWMKAEDKNPVVTFGSSGTWEDNGVCCSRVLHNGQFYEMWYAGTRTDNAFISQIGYATSDDGISWTKSPDNPIIDRGQMGTWDRTGVLPGEVLLDGDIYYMWYDGYDGSNLRAGLAVSPKGMDVYVSEDTVSIGDTVWVTVRVENPVGLSFSAEIKDENNNIVDVIDLMMDYGFFGSFFVTHFVPEDEGKFIVDIALHLDTLNFRMYNGADFDVLSPTSVSTGMKLPDKFQLEQNYPNPFNSSTLIGFQLPVDGWVTLKIYNVLGEEIATLLNEQMRPGRYEITWDATGFASGVYLYRLSAVDFKETKKSMLLR